MKVALVHDWITGLRGGEKCLLDFLSIYPEADIYTLIHKKGVTSDLIDERICQTSFFQKIPNVSKFYKILLPFYPLATKSLKLKGYDLVISLSHAAAKNVQILDNAYHISYCFTPMRYIWDQAPQYFGKLLPLVWPMITYLRKWDVRHSSGVNTFVGISSFVASRINSYYKREANVIYPAVNTSWIESASEGDRGKYFLYAGAIVPYKRVDLIVAACSKLKIPLIVANEPTKSLKKIAGSTVQFTGKPNNKELAELYKNCRALIFPAKEDFGMVPIECMAAGRPVICLDCGGTKETVNGAPYWNYSGISEVDLAEKHHSGVFIKECSNNKDLLAELINSLNFFQKYEGCFSTIDCARQSLKFRPQIFFDSWHSLLNKLNLS